MSKLENVQAGMEKVIGPVADKLTNSKILKAITGGFLGTILISLGVAFFSVIINLPIPAWQTLLTNTGILDLVNGVLNVTINMMGIYTVIGISYTYTKNAGENPLTGVMLSLAAFFVLMPLQIVGEGFAAATMIDISYLGSKGLFVAIILGVSVSALYCFLSSKNLKLKFPDSVPPMVSDAFGPTIIAMIIVLVLLVCKALFQLLPGGNLFDFIVNVVSQPLMAMAATPLSLILFYTFSNFLWFLGIHPAALNGIWLPILFSAGAANTQAFLNGDPMPFVMFSVLSSCAYIGGQGNTLALSVLTLVAKSERYKSMRKLVIIPNFFNINEPAVFGFPVMLNPYYFFPMVFTSLISGFAAWGLCLVGMLPAFNPTVSTAWAMPVFITAVLSGGFKYLLLVLICFVIDVLVYYPFFRMEDNKHYKEEQSQASAN